MNYCSRCGVTAGECHRRRSTSIPITCCGQCTHSKDDGLGPIRALADAWWNNRDNDSVTLTYARACQLLREAMERAQ